MLNFIDISSYQGNIDLSVLPIDGVIVKATEGISYVNPWCEPKVQSARLNNLAWGFYHYAKSNDPIAEADYFIQNCDGYFGEGVPVLDWEENQSVDWVNAFVKRVHDVKGIWCVIYGNPWRFNQGGVEQNCGRWVASYPSHLLYPNFDVDEGECPDTDGLVCAWQFASDGRLNGYDGNLDLNRFYGDKGAWAAYAGAKVDLDPEPQPEPTPEEPEKPQEPEKDGNCEGTHHVVHLGDTVELAKD